MAHELNLIPEDIIERREWQKSLLRWAGPILLGIVVIGAIYGLSRLWITPVNQDISRLLQERTRTQVMKEKIGRLQAERKKLLMIEKRYLSP